MSFSISINKIFDDANRCGCGRLYRIWTSRTEDCSVKKVKKIQGLFEEMVVCLCDRKYGISLIRSVTTQADKNEKFWCFIGVNGLWDTKTSYSILTHSISMASSSSSSIMASPGANASSYDVFLSFRGEDTRHNFTDHLYERLRTAGILTFRDEEEIERGEKVKPEIENAIKGSRASIVVLSENYATSTWCLDELYLILQQRREGDHFVLPVFYKVDPSDVGKQHKTFAIEVKASSRWTDQNVNLWKEALTEVAGLAGEVLSRYASLSLSL
ncbi:unnamed protein product [Lactuca saligna]|uniref:TIR domain-containing protein n=1 Tax=Lactuca saligna TaxID=75948 RepID=A0AA35ZJU4_LACSI|nr:unnamed protein product [Lactuca saligna]